MTEFAPQTVTEEIALEGPPAALARISWGAVIAGFLLVIAVQALFNLLGLGVGITALEAATTPTTLTGWGVAWWVVATWAALGFGAYVASRLAGAYWNVDGLLHGLLVWAMALIVSAIAISAAIGLGTLTLGHALGGAAATMLGDTAQARAAMGKGTPPASSDANRLKDAATGLLRPADPTKLSDAAASEELERGLTSLASGQGEGDRDRLTALIAARAGISQSDAAQRLASWETAAKQRQADAQTKAAAFAREAPRLARDGAFVGFLLLLLGAVASALGGIAGAHGPLATRALALRTMTIPGRRAVVG